MDLGGILIQFAVESVLRCNPFAREKLGYYMTLSLRCRQNVIKQHMYISVQIFAMICFHLRQQEVFTTVNKSF